MRSLVFLFVFAHVLFGCIGEDDFSLVDSIVEENLLKNISDIIPDNPIVAADQIIIASTSPLKGNMSEAILTTLAVGKTLAASINSTPTIENKKSSTPRQTAQNIVKEESSTICKTCRCQSFEPLEILCDNMNLSKMFLDADWPNDITIISIDANFESNNFTEIIKFPSLPLVNLNFRHNSIFAIEPAAFKNLSALVSLNLSWNKLRQQALFRDVFQGRYSNDEYQPIALKILKLGYNAIHSLNKDAFDHTPYLTTLELNDNPIKVIDHETAMAITSLRKLEVLNLAETKINSLPEGFLHSLRHLKTLVLSGNHFLSVPSEMHQLHDLLHLNLNNNPIRSLNSESFHGLCSLRQLNISAMEKLEKIEEHTFSSLHSMETLYCSYNPVLKHVSPRAFAGIAGNEDELVLKQFHFRGNQLPLIHRQLLPWDFISTIDIEENPFVCNCKIKWMITDLIPTIAKKTPDLAVNLKCAKPQEHHGRSLFELHDQLDECDGDHDVDDDEEENSTRPTGSSSGKIILLSSMLIFLMVCITAVAIVLVVRRFYSRQQFDKKSGQIIHYLRTAGHSRDDEYAIIGREGE